MKYTCRHPFLKSTRYRLLKYRGCRVDLDLFDDLQALRDTLPKGMKTCGAVCSFNLRERHVVIGLPRPPVYTSLGHETWHAVIALRRMLARNAYWRSLSLAAREERLADLNGRIINEVCGVVAKEENEKVSSGS